MVSFRTCSRGVHTQLGGTERDKKLSSYLAQRTRKINHSFQDVRQRVKWLSHGSKGTVMIFSKVRKVEGYSAWRSKCECLCDSLGIFSLSSMKRDPLCGPHNHGLMHSRFISLGYGYNIPSLASSSLCPGAWEWLCSRIFWVEYHCLIQRWEYG